MFKIIILLTALLANPVLSKNITAQSWLVTDYKGKIIDGENYDQVRSIASISKLVTVMTVLDANLDLDQKINQYTRRELIQLALVKSDNKAAIDLCKSYPGGIHDCVEAMNYKIHTLGLTNTKFVEPTGLSVMNVSTAKDLVDIVLEASHYEEVVQAARSSEVKIQIRKKWLIFHNTNPIVGKRHDVVVSKTGWITTSGGCLVMMVDTEIGRRVIIVLGSKTIRTRIPDAEFLLFTY
jgi:D-alanyl-D-alanine carboxypeptidase